jgi:hypothetical protein
VKNATKGAKLEKNRKEAVPNGFFLQNFQLFNFTYISTDCSHKKWNILEKKLAKNSIPPLPREGAATPFLTA